MNVPCGGCANLKASRLSGKFSVALVQEQQRAAAANHQKILHALVLEIGEQRAGGVIQHSDAGCFRHIFKCSIAAIAIEAVGKSRRLADVEIIKSVVVEISGGQAVVAVDVDADSAIQNRAPVVHSVKHLVFVGRGLAESLRRDVNENGLRARG